VLLTTVALGLVGIVVGAIELFKGRTTRNRIFGVVGALVALFYIVQVGQHLDRDIRRMKQLRGVSKAPEANPAPASRNPGPKSPAPKKPNVDPYRAYRSVVAKLPVHDAPDAKHKVAASQEALREYGWFQTSGGKRHAVSPGGKGLIVFVKRAEKCGRAIRVARAMGSRGQVAVVTRGGSLFPLPQVSTSKPAGALVIGIEPERRGSAREAFSLLADGRRLEYPRSLGLLSTELRTLRRNNKSPDGPAVVVVPRSEISLGSLVQVIDTCIRYGEVKVGRITIDPRRVR
jgi:hypothetical protein